ncbi:carboxymuconolactone decarboxylase family protein [Agarivorans sp. DSG3-1]|uniref:carboxymuconolactone decarboxylase family protein n=1 Tax=Agarivorans sp. DSG3-1 TaxID=3342249 RepID=UPI00398ECD68
MFNYHDIETAPEASKAIMEQSKKALGLIPNLHRVLADAPATYQAYLKTYELFTQSTLFSPLEAQVVLMTSNFENNCHYCVPGHTWIMKSANMPESIIEALREGNELPDAKLQALHVFTKELLDNRGHIGDEKLQNFLDAGYTERHALEVLTGLACKLISNFTNALSRTPVDEPLKVFDWTHPSER